MKRMTYIGTERGSNTSSARVNASLTFVSATYASLSMFALISKPDPDRRSRASLVLDGSYSSPSSKSSPPRLPRARPENSKSPRSRPPPDRPRGSRSNTSKSPSSQDAYELLVPVDDDALARAFSFRTGADNGRATTTRVVLARRRARRRARARARGVATPIASSSRARST